MRSTILIALTTLAAALPADAQERRERVRIERDGAEGRLAPRVLQIARSPRAVLGVMLGSTSGRADTLGVRVESVTEEGPAARAGIEEGAWLQSIDGVNLRISAADAEDPMLSDLGRRRLTRTLGEKEPGDEVELRVYADNQVRTVRVRLADSDSLLRTRAATVAGRARALVASRANRASLGLSVGSTGSKRDTLGVFVMRADDEGPAAKAGVFEGARIASINGEDLRVPAADAGDSYVAQARVQRLMRELGDVKAGDEVELRVWQNGQFRNVRVRAVASDSLRRNRSTFIIGDGMPFFGAPDFPRTFSFPRGPEGGAFRFELAPHMRRDLDVIIDGAMRGAGRALHAAPRGQRILH